MVMEWLEQLCNCGYIDYVMSLFNCVCLMEVLCVCVYVQGVGGVFCVVLGIDICLCEYLFDMVKVFGWDYVEFFLVQVSCVLCEVLDGQFVYWVMIIIFVFFYDGSVVEWQEYIVNVCQQFVQLLEIYGILYQLDIVIGVLLVVDEIVGSDVVCVLLMVIDVSCEEGVCLCQFELVYVENQCNVFWLFLVLLMVFMVVDELSLYYQFKVCLCDGSCVGVEVLICWQYLVLGYIFFVVFIVLVEKMVQICQIMVWVVCYVVVQVV